MGGAGREPMAMLEAAAEQLWGAARLPALRPLLRRTAEALATVQAVPLPPAALTPPFGHPSPARGRGPAARPGRGAGGEGTDLTELSAAEAAERIARRELSPVDLVEALLARTTRLDPELRVWAHLDAEEARAAARRLADEAARGALRGPLHGVPIGVKDIFHVAGLPTRAGSRVYRSEPTEDATVVARLRRAGAIILGKTHTTEFAYADPAPTRNPWRPTHTPGGSSSGSAAGVAARMVPVALGTQTAGSVLRPASFCGVVGFKPTYGRLSRHGVLPLAWTLDHPGTLTRTVADAALLLSVMAGPDGRDDLCADVPVADYRAAVRDPRPPRVGLVGEVYPERLSTAARTCLGETARRLERAGATLVPLELPPILSAALDTHHLLMASEASAVHLEGIRAQPEVYGPRLRLLVEVGALIPAPAYLRAQRLRRLIRAAVLPLFEQADCLLVPAAPGAAPAGLDSTGDPSFNAPWSLLGLPAIALPAGLDPEGLPLGVQLVAAPWREAELLAAAAWCERVLPPMPAPPG
jgi:aspartyl-tRNA(Asn)/glutamyl-tRNA(Gln) amidotransferase subunit A